MEQKKYYLPIETPDGMFKLEINHHVVNRDADDMRVTLSTTIQEKTVFIKQKQPKKR